MVNFDPDEYVTSVDVHTSETASPSAINGAASEAVIGLKFVTNKNTYGPYGDTVSAGVVKKTVSGGALLYTRARYGWHISCMQFVFTDNCTVV